MGNAARSSIKVWRSSLEPKLEKSKDLNYGCLKMWSTASEGGIHIRRLMYQPNHAISCHRISTMWSSRFFLAQGFLFPHRRVCSRRRSRKQVRQVPLFRSSFPNAANSSRCGPVAAHWVCLCSRKQATCQYLCELYIETEPSALNWWMAEPTALGRVGER